MKVTYGMNVIEAEAIRGDSRVWDALGRAFVDEVKHAIANGKIYVVNAQIDVAGVLYEPDGTPAADQEKHQ